MYRVVIVFLLIICHSFFADAKKGMRTFALDSTARTSSVLNFRGYRVLNPEYQDGSAGYYFLGKKEGGYPAKSLACLIEQLLSANACNSCASEDSLFISIHEFRFYDQPVNGEVMSLFLRADFFRGRQDELHHIYSTDTLFQQRQRKNSSAQFVASSVLQSVISAEMHRNEADPTALSNQQAVHFYEDQLMKYPLYGNSNPTIGLFATVQDFLNLSPSETDLVFEHIPSPEGDGYNYFYKKERDGSKGARISGKDFYAGCDGKDFWLYSGNGFHKIKKSGGEYYFEISEKLLTSMSSQNYYSGGALGYLASSALNESLAATGAKGHKERRTVTGRFSPQKRRFVPASDKGPLPR